MRSTGFGRRPLSLVDAVDGKAGAFNQVCVAVGRYELNPSSKKRLATSATCGLS